MSSQIQRNVFITSSNPEQFKSKCNRRTVSSVASKICRPTSKRIVLGRTLYRPFLQRGEERSSPKSEGQDESKSSSSQNDTEQALTRVMETTFLKGSPLGSPLVDPFESYPVQIRPYVPFLVDYFIRFLTPRFSPALATETSRYLVWFNVSMHNPELFHVLIALSQAYYNIDQRGFGQPHTISLYHRGEGLKQLRKKFETAKAADDDASILAVLWLMDVDQAANGDGHAFSMHKRAQEHFVSTRGGIRKLHPELQDELLKSEFFLPLLLYGSFACEFTRGDVLVRFKEHGPVKAWPENNASAVLSTITAKRLLISPTVDILQGIFEHVSLEPRYMRTASADITGCEGLTSQSIPTQRISPMTEMFRVLHLTDQVKLKTLDHRIILALLVYIFNLHNQPGAFTLAPSPTGTPSDSRDSSPRSYLDILSDVALEMTRPSHPEDPDRVTEREVTLWTMVAIGSSAAFSPWRLEIPFMGHMIVLMENDGKQTEQGCVSGADLVASTSGPRSDCGQVHPMEPSNLDTLTQYLRGYYLYGADKVHLDSLPRWKN
ncbi:uncharacterized protein A1O9_07925 [Exophiala aquamarina CBS 119918]|uniref:Transcription factor domain-containing protein n=1 Tax=Exophiala aquamarina CBS 119918 TaxID=1182545 RepID=A0A072P8D4_9EURO|nr:uncharacterized protein A1O9_07925 [Exophiala aquamarina CBS 119918]KEF56344.1 hypothetical protein A1O9_07925 [Exophiala aquamarina CBS 119918]